MSDVNVNSIHKMKVKDLRKLVSDNYIFRGGLSSMKKGEIIDSILKSDWYKLNGGIIPEPQPQPEPEIIAQPEPEPEIIAQPVEPQPVEPQPVEPQPELQPELQPEPQHELQSELQPEPAQDLPPLPLKRELQNRLQFLQQQLEMKQKEEEELQKQISFEKEDDRIKKMIQDALEQQKQTFMNRLFS